MKPRKCKLVVTSKKMVGFQFHLIIYFTGIEVTSVRSLLHDKQGEGWISPKRHELPKKGWSLFQVLRWIDGAMEEGEVLSSLWLVPSGMHLSKWIAERTELHLGNFISRSLYDFYGVLVPAIFEIQVEQE